VGANVAFRVALLQPDSVSTLVLVSPDCVRPATGQPWNTPELAALAMLAHPEAPGQPLPDPDRTAVLSALAEGSRTTDGDVAQLLPELGCATLVVFGQEDRLVSRDAGGTWKAQVPNCNVCYVYDAGHAVGMDRPDALANVVLDFVERRETFIVENRTSLINP
jgi:pimeloyl-ACP methyl ester carboxylesterase